MRESRTSGRHPHHHQYRHRRPGDDQRFRPDRKLEILRKTRGGRMISVTVTLSDWLFRAVLGRSVLTLSRDYFSLRKPLERRIYELARKHCGRQPDWRVSLAVLHKKAGSAAPLRVSAPPSAR
ncbi:replication initiator protein A [Gemmobacter lanyuensis]